MVPVLNDRDNALKAHLYATELRTYLNLPEQSTTEELKNGVVTFSSKQGGTQLQIAVSLAVYLNILKDDAGQGVLEQGVRSAVPALRAVEQMLAAA
jgi:stringent starvation protein B